MLMKILETQPSTHVAMHVQAAVLVGKLGKEVINHYYYHQYFIPRSPLFTDLKIKSEDFCFPEFYLCS